MMNKPSLRDIKREATANALADAAYELVLERGLDGFIVDDIVQRAGYSRRTFANYYSCKEEAVAAAAITFKGAGEAEALLSGLTDGDTPLEVLLRLMKLQFTAEHLGKLRELVSLCERHPSLEPYILSALHRLQVTAQETLSHLSDGRYPEAYTHLLAGAVYGAVMPLLNGSIQVLFPGESGEASSEAVTFEHYLDTMFGYLRNGF